jgi:hypothetical protein
MVEERRTQNDAHAAEVARQKKLWTQRNENVRNAPEAEANGPGRLQPGNAANNPR